jgi:hypothetical protein
MRQLRTQAKEAISITFSMFRKSSEHLALLENTESLFLDVFLECVFLEYEPLLSVLEEILAYASHLTEDKINAVIEMMKTNKTSSIGLQEWFPKLETPRVADQPSHFLKYYVAYAFYNTVCDLKQTSHFFKNLSIMTGNPIILDSKTLDKLMGNVLATFKNTILKSVQYTRATVLFKKAGIEFIGRLLPKKLKTDIENNMSDKGIAPEIPLTIPTGISLTVTTAAIQSMTASGSISKESQKILIKIRKLRLLLDSVLADKDFLDRIESNLEAADLLLEAVFDRCVYHDADKCKDFMLDKISRLKAVSVSRNTTNLMTIKDYLELTLEEKFFVLRLQENNLKGSKLEPLPLEIIIRIIQQDISKALPSCSLYGMQDFPVQRKPIVEATEEVLDEENLASHFSSMQLR